MHLAKGTFDVKVLPVAPDAGDSAGFGRLTLNKVFHGDLDGTSTGVMLGVQSAMKGSGGYVALEVFSGTLRGKRGTFVLQHNGTMQGGKFQLNVVVVPDSGTGELAGIAGTLEIIIAADGTHSYEFLITQSTPSEGTQGKL
jgi:hypothetical protein